MHKCSDGVSIGAGGAVPHHAFSGNSFLFMNRFISSKLQENTAEFTLLPLVLDQP